MKVLAVLLLASYGLAHQTQSEYHQFKSWAEAKAMESCWGEENYKIYVVSMKKAVAKCRQQDAPELELPPYRSAYKFVNVLTSSADNMEQNKLEQVFKMMKFFQERQNEEHHDHQHSHHHDHQRDYQQDLRNSQYGRQDMMKKMMMKYKMEQMMEKFMNEGSYASNKMDDHDMYAHKEHASRFDYGMTRPQRAAGDGIKTIDLGDKLVARINSQKEEMVNEIGNMTCVLKEMGMLNAENEIDVPSMKQKLSEYSLPSKWFKNKFEELIDNCYEMATNLPAAINEQSIVSGDLGKVNVGQVKHFLKCYKECHQKICMNQDTKKKIESNYGPLEDILEQTGWTEHQFFPAFMQLTNEGNEYTGY